MSSSSETGRVMHLSFDQGHMSTLSCGQLIISCSQQSAIDNGVKEFYRSTDTNAVFTAHNWML